jgi:LmbE family N-acetylglucosaminyl deacetylase
MADFYADVYLSPHLDDAVLSCGGAIHQQVMAGRRPLVVTLFAGRPPANVDLSDFAQSLHARWRDSADLIATRWTEDQAALTALGADYLRLNYPDCIYRGREQADEWYYASEEAIFGRVHPAEQGLPVELAATLSEFIPPGDGVTLYVPLTIGNHVDHQVAFATALILKAQGWQVQFYEDYPYAETDGAVAAALAARGASHWQSTLVPLGKEDLEAKIQAIACYESQIRVLFGNVEAMHEQVRNYATQVGGERLWKSG